MSSTSYNSTKMGGKKNKTKTVPPKQTKKYLFPIPLPKLYSISTFVEYLQVLKYIHPLLSIESHLVQVIREPKKRKKKNFSSEPTKIMLLTLHRVGSPVAAAA